MNIPLNVNVCKGRVITFPYGFNNTGKQNSLWVQLIEKPVI